MVNGTVIYTPSAYEFISFRFILSQLLLNNPIKIIKTSFTVKGCRVSPYNTILFYQKNDKIYQSDRFKKTKGREGR